MAAEYEVNIKLNTKEIDGKLKNIDTTVKNIGKTEKQTANTSDRRVASLVKLRSIGDDVAALQKKGLDLSKAEMQLKKAGEAIDKKMFLTANQRMGVAVKHLNVQRGITKELERQEKAQRRQRAKRLEGVALGAGFPMLFGGGAGSVLGGGLGGLTGSFGAQIAFSAIGQQIDQFINGVLETGKAFGSLGETLDLMRERSLFTSEDSEELARQLENLGDVEGLAELATIELASKIGSEGIGAFQDLETEIDEFDRLVQNLMLSLQAFLAGPLANFLDVLNATLGKQVTKGTIDRLAGSLSNPEDQERFRRAAKAQIGTEIEIGGRLGGLGLGLGGIPQSREVLKAAPLDLLSDLARQVSEGQFGPSSLTSRKLKITKQDRENIRPPRAKKSNAERERKRMERLMEQSRERIRLLDLQIEKNAKLSDIQEGINEASFYGNKLQSLQLQSEKRILEINYQRDRAIERINDQLPESQRAAEALKITEEAQQKISMERLDLAHQIRVTEQGQFEERLKNIQKSIDMQYELNEAVQQQLALADGISSVMGQGMTQAFDALIDGAENWGRALQDIAANVLRDIAKQLIQIYVIEQAVGFMKNLLSPGLPQLATSALPGTSGFGARIPSTGKILQSASARADGGSVSSGRPYFVGERGPELFVPGASGNIVPNHAMGGANVTVNVDASGTQAQGSQPNAKLLGQAIGAAVQAELIKQKRPGGLLAV